MMEYQLRVCASSTLLLQLVFFTLLSSASDYSQNFRIFDIFCNKDFRIFDSFGKKDFRIFDNFGKKDFRAFRKRANEEYAAALQWAWTMMGVEPAVPNPKEPEPPKPQNVDIDKMPTTIPLPHGEVVVEPAKTAPSSSPYWYAT